jgi:rhodanese-related sulfurtransferase
LRKFFQALIATLALLVGSLSVTACSSEKVDPAAYAAVIDVRTEAEWQTGHLETAVLFDISSPDFEANLASLDKSADYFVYCRSGNRAGQAIDRMKALGFTGELVNGGAVADAAAATGIPVVQ